MSFLPPQADPYPPHGRAPPPPPGPPASGGPAAWPLWAPFATLIGGVVIATIVTVTLLGIVEAAGIAEVKSGEDPPPGVTLGGTFAQDIAFALGVVVAAWLSAGRPRAEDFGLRPSPLWRTIGWMLAAWLGFVLFSAIYDAALDVPDQDDLPEELGADDDTLAMLGTALLVCVAAPIAEELLFRGFLFGAARERMHVVLAMVLSGIVFGIVHAAGSPVEVLPVLAVLGFMLAWLYHQTGSLYPCIALHLVNNSLALGVSLDWDWQIPVVAACSGVVVTGLLAGARRLDRVGRAVA